jgi:pimeloyl-ACP methyl ester carboxylesterase
MTRARWTILALVLGILLVVAVVYRQSLVLRIASMRPFVEDRFDGWVRDGADEAELDAAFRRVHDPTGSGPGSWVYEVSVPAAQHQARARELEAAGDVEGAAEEWRQAALFYYIARFPFLGNEAKVAAYRKHIDCYLESVKHEEPALEIVRIPHQGEEIIGYLRVPPSALPPPVVVVTGGVDTWKSDVEGQAKAMLAEGMAAFTFDMPGTGESAWPLSADGERIYSRVLAYLKTRADLDGDRMAVYLQSFAGYYAVKLAVLDPNVKAAVNVGGPIHLSFTMEHAETVHEGMIKTIAHAMGEDLDQPLAEMIEKIEPFSLERQGLLRPPERQAPLLSINGDQDALVTIDDLYIISEKGIVQEEWVYEGDGHCASGNASEHVPRAAAWIKAQLGRTGPS